MSSGMDGLLGAVKNVRSLILLSLSALGAKRDAVADRICITNVCDGFKTLPHTGPCDAVDDILHTIGMTLFAAEIPIVKVTHPSGEPCAHCGHPWQEHDWTQENGAPPNRCMKVIERPQRLPWRWCTCPTYIEPEARP